MSTYKPKAIFETLKNTIEQYKELQKSSAPDKDIEEWLSFCLQETEFPSYAVQDFKLGLGFLYSYRGSADTFASYRRALVKSI